jgi:replicative DNA helicase
MKLSAPIFQLKHKAKKLARDTHIPLNKALNRIAKDEGFSSWSLLAARALASPPSAKLFAQLNSGDLVLLGARPGHGKTMIAVALSVDTVKAGHKAIFFSLECNHNEVLERFLEAGGDPAELNDKFQIDCSDTINADYIVRLLTSAVRGTLIVIDYLQILDQKRDSPNLSVQLSVLNSFAKNTGLIIVCISQIDRSYELSGRPLPDMTDVRLPNPIDLSLFNKACFLNNGEVRVEVMN